MKRLFFLFCCFYTLSSCSLQSAEFLTKTAYTGKQKLKNVFVVVVSDKDTKDCMQYYENFLIDSLKKSDIDAEGTFYCCRNKNSDMVDIINSSLPSTKYYENILIIVVSKTIIGHGTSSTRELQLDLFDDTTKKKTWDGKLSDTFSWFVSDDNYRKVATKFTMATLKELRSKSIL